MKIQIKIIMAIACMCIIHTTQAQYEMLKVPYRCGKLWGYADTSGTVLITPAYDSVSLFTENYILEKEIACVYKNGKTGIIDEEGKIVLPLVWDSLYTIFSQGELLNALVVKKGKLFGVINFYSAILIPTLYDALEPHDFFIIDGLYKNCAGTTFLAKIDKAYYTIDLEGKKTAVTEKFYQDNLNQNFGVASYSDEIVENMKTLDFNTFKRENKKLFDSLNTNQFDNRSGYYVIYKNNKQGLVNESNIRDKSKATIITPIYDEIIDVKYTEGFATQFLVRKNGYISVIDTSGNVLMPFKYKQYTSWDNSFVFTMQDGKHGFYDLKTGYELLPEYDTINWLGGNFRIWKVKQNGVWTYMTDQKKTYVCQE